VGGAERSARNRKRMQQQTAGGKAVAAARGSGRKPIVIGAIVVVAIAAVVIVGVLLTRKSAPETPQNAAPVQAGYQVTVGDDGVVVAGKPDAAITVDIYEDFLCPACGAMFQQSHVDMENALAGGQLKARFHLVNFLDSKSDPSGYSMEAANAALCAGTSGKFPEVYNTLFTTQPAEGGPGYSVDQLVDIGKRAGITSADFEPCVRQGTHKAGVQANFAQAKKDLEPFYHGGFATPTVVYNGQSIEALNKPGWVKDLLAGKTTPAS
jgi:protein-disulfide isomerase